MAWAEFAPCHTLIFDLDDTILDLGGAREDWQTICVESAQSHAIDAALLFSGIEFAQHEYWSDASRHRVGRLDLLAAMTAILKTALEHIGADCAIAPELALRYRELRDNALHLFPGAIDTLEHLREKGFTLGLLTNGAADVQRAKIDRFNLASYFSYIGIEGEVGYGKPLPKAYERALNTLGVSSVDSWMIGDNYEWEVLAPKSLGMRAIWVKHESKRHPDATPVEPDRVIAAISELI